jgi:hypothetical protein
MMCLFNGCGFYKIAIQERLMAFSTDSKRWDNYQAIIPAVANL